MNDRLKNLITHIVEKYFNNLKLRLIGPQSVSRTMFFQMEDFDPKATILGAYLHANSIHGAGAEFPDPISIKKLEAVANHYIDSMKAKTDADVIRTVSDALDSANRKSKIDNEDPQTWIRGEEGQDLLDNVKKELEDQRKKIVKAVDTLTQVELSNSQNIGSADGILAVAQKVGIADPVVFKIGILDEKRCLVKGSSVELVGGNKKAVEDLIIGDILRSHKNLSGKQDRSIKLNSKVESICKRTEKCLEIELYGGSTIRCSENHPILIYFNSIYLFWAAGDLKNRIEDIEVVDIKSLSVRQKKKLTQDLNPSLSKKNDFKDLWSFILSEQDSICSMYLEGATLKSICASYCVNQKNQKYISAILKLSGVFKKYRHSKNNRFNSEYVKKRTERDLQKIALLKEDLLKDMVEGISGKQISDKYGISRYLFGRFLKSIDKTTYNKWISSVKSHGAKATWNKIMANPKLMSYFIDRATKSLMQTALKGSKPQYQLSLMFKELGYDVQYNTPINDKIRVDMVIDKTIVVEFDGSGHDIQVRMGNITKEKLAKKDYARDLICKKLGYKVIRIKSRKDKIPSLQSLNDAIHVIKKNTNSYFEIIHED